MDTTKRPEPAEAMTALWSAYDLLCLSLEIGRDETGDMQYKHLDKINDLFEVIYDCQRELSLSSLIK